MRSRTRSTAGTVSPIPRATGTSAANVRARWGTSAKTRISTTGVAYSAPRLWLSSARSASSTTPPHSTPRSAQGMRLLLASSSAGQAAINQVAAAAFS